MSTTTGVPAGVRASLRYNCELLPEEGLHEPVGKMHESELERVPPAQQWPEQGFNPLVLHLCLL